MAVTKPAIASLRTNSLRDLQGMIAQLNQRFEAIDALLQTGNGVTLQTVINTLLAQPDGTVVKAKGALKTQKP